MYILAPLPHCVRARRAYNPPTRRTARIIASSPGFAPRRSIRTTRRAAPFLTVSHFSLALRRDCRSCARKHFLSALNCGSHIPFWTSGRPSFRHAPYDVTSAEHRVRDVNTDFENAIANFELRPEHVARLGRAAGWREFWIEKLWKKTRSIAIERREGNQTRWPPPCRLWRCCWRAAWSRRRAGTMAPGETTSSIWFGAARERRTSRPASKRRASKPTSSPSSGQDC